jgi:hypothetical protein
LSIVLPSFYRSSQLSQASRPWEFSTYRSSQLSQASRPWEFSTLVQEPEQVVLDRLLTVVTILVLARDRDKRIEALMHVIREALDIVHAAVVRQVELHGLLRHDPVDRLVRLRWLEMRWRGRGKNELAFCGVQLPVGETETIARKHTARPGVVQTIMVPRVAFGVQRTNLAAAEAEAVFVTGLHDTPGIDRNDVAV